MSYNSDPVADRRLYLLCVSAGRHLKIIIHNYPTFAVFMLSTPVETKRRYYDIKKKAQYRNTKPNQ
jgi:hypothetical protein